MVRQICKGDFYIQMWYIERRLESLNKQEQKKFLKGLLKDLKKQERIYKIIKANNFVTKVLGVASAGAVLLGSIGAAILFCGDGNPELMSTFEKIAGAGSSGFILTIFKLIVVDVQLTDPDKVDKYMGEIKEEIKKVKELYRNIGKKIEEKGV